MYIMWVKSILDHSVCLREGYVRGYTMVLCLTFLACHLLVKQVDFPLACWDQWLSEIFLLLLRMQKNLLIFLMGEKSQKNIPQCTQNVQKSKGKQ